MAITLLDGDLTFATAHDYQRMGDPRVMELRRRIELRGDQSLVTPESPRQAVVELMTEGGQHFRNHVVKVRGTAQDPMTTEEVEEKARELMAPCLGRGKAGRLIAAIGSLEALDSVRELRPLLRR